MSDEAVKVSGTARNAAGNDAWLAARNDAWTAAGNAAGIAARNAARNATRNAAGNDAWYAATAEVASDLISPENYRILTNPVATGRAVDVLAARPRNQGTPFLDVVRNMGERKAITSPRDVVVASRLAKSPEDIREIALTLMSDGMSAEEAMRTARML
jgi:hypothetical protein